MPAHSMFFYFFSTVAIFSSVMVTISKNTVYSVFFLILVFINTSILFIIIGAEFLGMIMLIVYVGAVAVLFLFIVMMLNVREEPTTLSKGRNFSKNISVGYLFGLIILLELLVAIAGWKHRGTFVSLSSIDSNIEITNTHAIGNVLYTDYIHLFQISGMILLVSMIGAIALTFKRRETSNKCSERRTL